MSVHANPLSFGSDMFNARRPEKEKEREKREEEKQTRREEEEGQSFLPPPLSHPDRNIYTRVQTII